ncbi:hypothetical protein HYFRA_00012623 [Hymenoscyphus fraxineus]|uniref:Rhodopsin domain-containing protein n=1 Tax=Hymenoscyphus fraxineus TaxID=746836 RepID=A0A9N9L7S6_9HELO|nr:hypothetical protein HYFRA_00012623 [Hymenoscyphus fraxineus]
MDQQINVSTMANLSAFPPPLNPQSNFSHPVSRAFVTYVSMGMCLGIAFIFVLLRCHVAILLKKTWGWEDSSCLIGFATLAAFSILVIDAQNLDLGNGSGRVTSSSIVMPERTDFAFILKFSVAAFGLIAFSSLFVRLSLFLLYLRLFKPDRLTRNFNYIGIACSLVFYTTTTILICSLCGTIPSKRGDIDPSWLARAESCRSPIFILTFAQSVFGLLSDIYLIVIPVRMVFCLCLPMKKKIGVSAIFLVGLLALACSITNLVFRVTLCEDADFAWNSISLYILSAFEICAGIICGSTPVLVALFRPRKPPPSRSNTHLTTRNRYFRTPFSRTASSGGGRFLEVETGSSEVLRSAMGHGRGKTEPVKERNEEWMEMGNGQGPRY